MKTIKLNEVLIILTVVPVALTFGLPIQGYTTIFHGFYFQNLMTFFWLLVFLGNYSTKGIPKIPAFVTRYFLLIVLLGILGLISSAVNFGIYKIKGEYLYRFYDFPQSCRLFVLAFYFLIIFYWAFKKSPSFILRWYLAGIAICGAINVYYTIYFPFKFIGILPFLYRKNGAGGFLALGILLGCWLWLIRDKKNCVDSWVAILVSLVGIAALILSFSKTTVLVGSCGVTAWIITYFFSPKKVLKLRYKMMLFCIFTIMLCYSFTNKKVVDVFMGFKRSLEVKFFSLSVDENNSIAFRYYYILAVLDILENNPLFGVGYSGFYPNVIQTQYYKSGVMETESAEGGILGQSNPHNSFTYFASANGIPGFVVVVSLFFLFIKLIYKSFKTRYKPFFSFLITSCFALAFFIYGNTLPNLFRSEVLYIPTAIAAAIFLINRKIIK